MYNDERNNGNLYHHTYERGGSEPGQRYDARPSVDEQLNRYRQQQEARQQTYRQGYQQGYQQGQSYTSPTPPPQPEKPKKSRLGLKVTALALCCALLGGAAGGGIVWAVMGGRTQPREGTEVSVSNRPTAAEVVLKTVDGQQKLTPSELYAANVNSVVSINVTAVSSGYNFFGQAVETASAGSGFVLTRDGYIVTNYHVVEGAKTIKVTFYSGDTYDAQYIGGDKDYDIAVIKIEAAGLQAVVLGNSDSLNVGDDVLAIGNPLGELTFSMSEGIASSVNRTINVSGTPFNMIQITCAVNPGNSGGPLYNAYGEVVGIVSAKYSSASSGSVEGLGFAIPINDVVAMIQDIMTNGHISNKPYLGITGGTMTQQMANQYRYDVSSGIFIYSTEPGHAAEKAGLQMGDVITAVDNNKIASMEDLVATKKHYSAGDKATLTVYRDGETIQVDIVWDATPVKEQDQQQQQQQQTPGGSQGGYYSNPWDMFDYFFGNGWG